MNNLIIKITRVVNIGSFSLLFTKVLSEDSSEDGYIFLMVAIVVMDTMELEDIHLLMT